MSNTEKYNVICLSNQQWDYVQPTNKKHVMSRLAKLGHNVLFVDPPINTGRLLLRQILRGQWGIGRLFTRTYSDQENAVVYSPLKPWPSAKVTSRWHIRKINRLSEKLFDPERKTVLWVYHVQIEELESFIDGISHDVLVYDCVDNYTAFPDNSLFYSATVPRELVVAQEKMLTERSDVVFATAPGLVTHLKKYKEEIHYTPNVSDYEKFSIVPKLKEEGNFPEDIASIRRPRIGFVGAVDEYKLDHDLLKKVATDYPNYNFVVIGPSGLKDKDVTREDLGFEGFDNVHFLGARPFGEIQNYVAAFDIYTIPYQLNDYTVGGCFPVKFHEGLASGLPVVVTDLPAYYPFSDVCYISKDYDDYSKNLKKALDENSPEKIKQRQQVASQNSWDGKVANLLELIQKNS